MPSLLYIVRRSPFMYSDLERASELASMQKEEGNDVGMVLMQDAVLITKKSEKSKMLEEIMVNGINIYVIEADCNARGINEMIIEGVKKVGYEEFIDLVMENYEKTVSF
ncbi:sulfurtransferase complex subunit TusB [Candidatus Borrarchaeum sp.]|jgi:sulfur relay protein TusB/DsrH|uniref:sulfurtransferase complex subunit TusB n=1 Tax=Candidatus Borrarchaeum sp. TaxID=2846742 RepID=UPI00257A18CE|nr:sulfurtransferase complex subunit TusB [Candidatus Borrarchaeum sp.]